MFYVAPAWSNEIKELGHDPLNNLINLLNEGNKDIKLVILNFLPNLRYILHENNLTRMDYWNVWDAILDIQRTNGMPLAPENLDLPDGIELIYSNNSISAYLNHTFYAKISINEKGYVTEVQIDGEEERRIDVYDDRGFKIQSKYYQADTITRMEWFNEEGQTIVRYVENASLKLQIVSEQERFNQSEYVDLNTLMLEMTNRMLQQDFQADTDALVVSPAPSLRDLMLQIQNQVPVNYICGHAGYLEDTAIRDFTPQIKGSKTFFVDNHYTLEQLQGALEPEAQKRLKLGYPYGTAMRLGNSNEERQLIVYWNVGITTASANIELTMKLLIRYMIEHSNVAIIAEAETWDISNAVANQAVDYLAEKYTFITDLRRNTVKSIIVAKDREQLVRALIVQLQEQIGNQDQSTDFNEFLNDLDTIQIRINSKSDEVFADLKRARILIDMGEPYDTLTQMNAISAGIPQINMVESPLVVNQRNGWVVTEQQTLTQGLNYFLAELSHWNRALVDSVQYMEQFAMQHQADWWERKIHGEKK